MINTINLYHYKIQSVESNVTAQKRERKNHNQYLECYDHSQDSRTPTVEQIEREGREGMGHRQIYISGYPQKIFLEVTEYF